MMTTTTKTAAAEVLLSGGGVQNNSPHGIRQHDPRCLAIFILHNSISHAEQRDAVRYISYKECVSLTRVHVHTASSAPLRQTGHNGTHKRSLVAQFQLSAPSGSLPILTARLKLPPDSSSWARRKHSTVEWLMVMCALLNTSLAGSLQQFSFREAVLPIIH